MPKKELFNLIKRETGLTFFYSSAAVTLPKTFTVAADSKTLDEILGIMFRGNDLEWSYSEDLILLKPKRKREESRGSSMDSIITYPTVSGKITSADGKSIPGASVMVKRTGDGIAADDQGNFSLPNLKRNDILLVRMVGYQAREISVKGSSIHITLSLDVQKLNTFNVISTGYEKAPKERVTGSFAYVNNELFNKRIGPGVLQRLEGNVPGLIFNRNTFLSQNGGIDINVQGHSTLFSNDQPLVVIDNFAYDGDIRNINPNDVESVTILRDAASASIWGVRSGNGVIVITTKKGSRNQKIATEFNANLTASDKPNLFYNPLFLNSTDYISIEQQLFDMGYYNNDILNPTKLLSPAVKILSDEKSGRITQKEADDALNKLKGQDLRKDMQNLLYQRSIMQQYSLNIRGGGINSDYAISVGFDKERQNLIGNKNQRTTLNTIYNLYPTKKLQLTLGINIVNLNNIANGDNGRSFVQYPYVKLIDENGSLLPIFKDYKSSYKDSMTSIGLLDWKYNPVQDINDRYIKNNATDNRINVSSSYEIINGLSLNLFYQYEQTKGESSNYYSINSYYARNLINRYTQISPTNELIYPIPLGGILQSTTSALSSHQARIQLNYSKNISTNQTITSIAGIELRNNEIESASNTAYGYDQETRNSFRNISYNTSYRLNPSSSGFIPNTLAYGKNTNNFLSYYANVGYTLKTIYDISGSARIDQSNIFGVKTNQKAVPLYSVGIGYTISNTPYYHLSWMSYSRIRATFGYSGNINNSATAIPTVTQFSNSALFGQPYGIIFNPGNPQLRWERTQKINIGYDFALWNYQVTGSLDYYFKKGIDLFGNSPLAPSTGLTDYFGNNASTRGHGFDLVLSAKIIQSKDFSLKQTLIFSNAIDKVTRYSAKVDNTNTFLSYSSGNDGLVTPKEGASIFGIYSYKSASLTHETGDPQGYLNGKISTDYGEILRATPIDSLIYNGPSRPTMFGSFRNTFTYKGLSLSINLAYKLNYFFRNLSTDNALAMYSDYTKRWQKPGDELITHVPSIKFPPFDANRSTFYKYSSPLVEKGDHVRIQDINISYDIPKSLLRLLPNTTFQIYSYINNVGIIWRANKSKIDPDLYGSGILIPTPRTYSLGVKAIF